MHHPALASPASKPDRRQKRPWRRIFWISAVLVIAGGAALAARPIYQHFRDQRLNANLESARAAVRVKDWGAARNLARSVLIGRPGDIEAYRIWYKSLAAMGEPRTYMAAAELFTDTRSTPEDKIDAFKVLCNQAPQAVALSAFASLSPEGRDGVDIRCALSPLLLMRGQTALAENMIRGAPGLQTSGPARLELIRILCAAPNVERVNEARQLFAGLIEENRTEALDALVLLGLTPGGLLPGDPLPSLPDWVDTRLDATTQQHLFALEPRLQALPESADTLIKQAIDRYLPVDPGILGTWLIKHGRSSQVIDLLKESATTHSGAYIARLHALMKEERTTEITAALESPPPAVDMVEFELIQAVLAHRGNEGTMEKKAWDRVLQEATFDQSRNRFLEIGRYAEAMGALATADDAMVAAVRLGWGRIPLYQDLLPLITRLTQQNRTEDVLAICRTLLRFEPGNAQIRNNYLYLGLLHHILEPADAVLQLQALQKSQPQIDGISSSLAFAYLLDKQPGKALELIGPQERKPQPALYLALYASALLAVDKQEEGRQALGRVEWERMLRQEAVALHGYLIGLQVRDLPLPDMVLSHKNDTDPSNTPAWRRAIEELEKNRSGDILPALPPPALPGNEGTKPDSH